MEVSQKERTSYITLRRDGRHSVLKSGRLTLFRRLNYLHREQDEVQSNCLKCIMHRGEELLID